MGGSQTAADGGLDVRVALPSDTKIDGYIPRPSTGFQVKKPDMPRAEIIAEMRPDGLLRPVIQRLADESGAYIIVSSTGSTTDSALRNRQDALRETLKDVGNADQLRTDFYDRTHLASWVRCHPGLIGWVKEKVGRASVGWRPYGPWGGGAESSDAEYLLDDKLRLHLGRHRDAPAQSVTQAIDGVRDELSAAGKVVRLVGLSGVGKTRLAQALFDARIGSRPLPPSLAIYTNLSDDPDPQPTGLASDLIANRTRAILIVDNCPPELPFTDGRCDNDKLGATCEQAAWYVLLVRRTLADLGLPSDAVSDDGFIILPMGVGLTPTLLVKNLTARVRRAEELFASTPSGADIPLNVLHLRFPAADADAIIQTH